MPNPKRHIDFTKLRGDAQSLPSRAVINGLGVRDGSTTLQEVKAANVAQQGIVQAIYDAVYRARAEGSSWSDIGGALEITKQAAQKRFTDEEAVIQAVFDARRCGDVIRVPKPLAQLFSPFEWIKKGMTEHRYQDASPSIFGRDAFVPVSVAEYVQHHSVSW